MEENGDRRNLSGIDGPPGRVVIGSNGDTRGDLDRSSSYRCRAMVQHVEPAQESHGMSMRHRKGIQARDVPHGE